MDYQDVADNMLDYFSEDAFYCWPCDKTAPIPISFHFQSTGSWKPRLQARLHEQLEGSYVYNEGTKLGAPLRLAATESEAQAVISLVEDPRDGDLGLAYSIRFAANDQEFEGWFSLAV